MLNEAMLSKLTHAVSAYYDGLADQVLRKTETGTAVVRDEIKVLRDTLLYRLTCCTPETLPPGDDGAPALFAKPDATMHYRDMGEYDLPDILGSRLRSVFMLALKPDDMPPLLRTVLTNAKGPEGMETKLECVCFFFMFRRNQPPVFMPVPLVFRSFGTEGKYAAALYPISWQVVLSEKQLENGDVEQEMLTVGEPKEVAEPRLQSFMQHCFHLTTNNHYLEEVKKVQAMGKPQHRPGITRLH